MNAIFSIDEQVKMLKLCIDGEKLQRLQNALDERADEQDIPRRERITAAEYLYGLLRDPEEMVTAIDPYNY